MKQKSEHAQVAQLIRKELKKLYPAIKFMVRSKSYSGGSSVNVDWENGPCQDIIQEIVNKYEYGSFDSMDDSYSYKKGFSGAGVQYCFANRSFSEEIKESKKQEILKSYNIKESELTWDGFHPKLSESIFVLVRRALYKQIFPLV